MVRVREVCVLGLGLIGGSVLRAATAAGYSGWGSAGSAEDVAAAAAEGFDVETSIGAAIRRAARAEAIIVLAVPLTAVDSVLEEVHAHAPHCLLTDVVSVKQPVADRVARVAPATRFIGSHPMAGATSSSWAASSAGLFDGAAWVLCIEQETDLAGWGEVARLALDAGAHVVPASAAAHDAAVARISHLPHVLAGLLASVGSGGGPLALSLAAGSFTDGTRVAGTRPELTQAMTEGNRDALLPVLDEALGLLGAARAALASTGSLAATINAGHEGAQALARGRSARRNAVHIDLSVAESAKALLALGEQGGMIVELDGMIATGLVPQAR